MEKFTGTLDELKGRVKVCGAEGDWTEIEYGHQFRCKDGARLNWYEKTGTIQYQGPKEAKERLKAALNGIAEVLEVGSADIPTVLLAGRLQWLTIPEIWAFFTEKPDDDEYCDVRAAKCC